jgi:cation diffusion facilitator CzcD-associated flavoprotein CzcO
MRHLTYRPRGQGRTPTVAVIGAGFAGIAAGVELKRAGFDSFTIYEAASAVGGTWWHNQYPGAEVDTPSLIYSYSFRPAVWSRTHVQQVELQGYMEAVVSEFGIGDNLQFNTDVRRVEWHEDKQHYSLYDAHGTFLGDANIVVSAVGFLNDPQYPDWPGLDTFRGPKFHTARWESQHDLTGKRVAVVGSGSTATQVVPSIAGTAGEVLMFQREPGWVVAKGGRSFSQREKQALRSRAAQRIVRSKMTLDRQRYQLGAKTFRSGSQNNLAAEKAAVRYIDSVFHDRPDLAALVTPSYPYGGKRPVITDDFYPSLLRDNVTLIPKAVTRVTETGVVDSSGEEHDVDVLIIATGFKPADYLSTLEVVGSGGRTIHEVWDGEPVAFLGMMMTGFPNFFMMYGPNTNGGAIVTNFQMQASYMRSAAQLLSRGAGSIDVRKSALDRYNDWLQRRMSGTVWDTFDNNYYKSASGRIVTQWPDGTMPYAILTKLFRRLVWQVKPSHRVSGSDGKQRGAASTLESSSLTLEQRPEPIGPNEPQDQGNVVHLVKDAEAVG